MGSTKRKNSGRISFCVTKCSLPSGVLNSIGPILNLKSTRKAGKVTLRIGRRSLTIRFNPLLQPKLFQSLSSIPGITLKPLA